MLGTTPGVHLPEKIGGNAANVPHQRIFELAVTDRAAHRRADLHPVAGWELAIHAWSFRSVTVGWEAQPSRNALPDYRDSSRESSTGAGCGRLQRAIGASISGWYDPEPEHAPAPGSAWSDRPARVCR